MSANTSNVFLGTGRRKRAIARVRLKKGKGAMTVNERPLNEYFYTEKLVGAALAPLETVDMAGQVDLFIRVHGGGPNGQATAVALGVARALQSMDASLRATLKPAGHLSRDPRKRERKKPGQPGARKRYQFSKR